LPGASAQRRRPRCAVARAPSPCSWCPEQEAGLISKLFFFFTGGLIQKGSHKHLEQADLWTTHSQDEPAKLWEAFERDLKATATAQAPQVRLSGPVELHDMDGLFQRV
jgi:hypothetical protein